MLLNYFTPALYLKSFEDLDPAWLVRRKIWLIVSKVSFSIDELKPYDVCQVEIVKAEGTVCPRCWNISEQADEEGLCPRCRKVLGL